MSPLHEKLTTKMMFAAKERNRKGFSARRAPHEREELVSFYLLLANSGRATDFSTGRFLIIHLCLMFLLLLDLLLLKRQGRGG